MSHSPCLPASESGILELHMLVSVAGILGCELLLAAVAQGAACPLLL
jgi:hypothetical protein